MKLSEAQEKSRKTGTEGYLNFRKGVGRLGSTIVWVVFLLYVVLLWPTSQDTGGPNAKTGKAYSQMLLGKDRVLCAQSLPGTGCQRLEIVYMDAHKIEFHQISQDGGRMIYRGKWIAKTAEYQGRYEGRVWMQKRNWREKKLFGEFGLQTDEHRTGEGWAKSYDGQPDEKFTIQIARK